MPKFDIINHYFDSLSLDLIQLIISIFVKIGHPKMTHKCISILLTIFMLQIGSIATATDRVDIDVPSPLVKATTAYKEKGLYAFLPSLFGGPLARGANSKIINETKILRRVERVYGNYTGLEMVGDIQVSSSTRIVFFIMKYKNGPLYGVLTTYKTSDNEKIIAFKINTEIHKIIPSNILSKYIIQ